jgi:hypothetical protein
MKTTSMADMAEELRFSMIFPVIQGVASSTRPPFSPHLEGSHWIIQNGVNGKTPLLFGMHNDAQFSEFPIYSHN